jgi:hypothetical protein
MRKIIIYKGCWMEYNNVLSIKDKGLLHYTLGSIRVLEDKTAGPSFFGSGPAFF